MGPTTLRSTTMVYSIPDTETGEKAERRRKPGATDDGGQRRSRELTAPMARSRDGVGRSDVVVRIQDVVEEEEIQVRNCERWLTFGWTYRRRRGALSLYAGRSGRSRAVQRSSLDSLRRRWKRSG